MDRNNYVGEAQKNLKKKKRIYRMKRRGTWDGDHKKKKEKVKERKTNAK